jgi:transposase-like protein
MNNTCIFCGEPVILGSFQKYTGGFYRQTYICRSCGRQYVDGPAFQEKPSDRRFNPLEKPPCPRCGSDNTMFNEWLETKERIKPRFKCLNCNRSFTLGGKLNSHKKYDEEKQ